MTDTEFLEQVELWALGGLDPDEAAAMEAHLAAHPSPRLRAARARAFDTAALLAAALPPAPPPPAVWRRIRAATTRRPRRPAVAWIVAAAAAVALLWLWRDRDQQAERIARLEGALAERQRTLTSAVDGCRRELDALRARDALAAEAVALLELPGTQLIPLERRPAAGATLAANAIYHRGVKRAYVVVAGFRAGGAYRVWIVRGGARVSAGDLAPDAGGRAVASVPRPSLEPGVPEKVQITAADGTLLLESSAPI